MPEVRTQLRMLESTHKWVKARAKSKGRSMNSEINEILKALQEQEEAEEQKAA